MILPAFLSPSAAGQEQTTQAEGLHQQGRPDAAPVNIATGTKIIAGPEDLDFSLRIAFRCTGGAFITAVIAQPACWAPAGCCRLKPGCYSALTARPPCFGYCAL